MRKSEIKNLSAIGWVRISTEKQGVASLESQEVSIRRYVANHEPPLRLVDIVKITESGYKKGKREGFYALLDRIKKEGIGNLVTLNDARLSRDPGGLNEVVEMIGRGLWLHYSESGDVFNAGNIDNKETEMGHAVYRAKETIKDLRAKARRVMENKLAAGIYPLNVFPYGYERKRGTDGKPAENISQSAEAPLSRRAFHLCASGESGFGVWTKLRAEGCRLGLSALSALLRSTVVVGYFPWPWPESKFVEKDHTKGEWIRGTWPPIVEREVWDRVQQILKARGRAHPFKSDQLFFQYRGLIRCGCGRLLSGMKVGKKTYYVPNHRHKELGPFCGARAIRSTVVDEQVEKALRRFEFPEETYDRLRGSLLEAKQENSRDLRKEKTRLEAEVKTVETAIEKAAMKALAGSFTAEEIARAVASLRDRKEKASAALALLNLDADRFVDDSLAILELVRDIAGTYKRASGPRKAELLRVLFKDVELNDGRLIFWPDGVFEAFWPLVEIPPARAARDFSSCSRSTISSLGAQSFRTNRS